MKYTEFSVMDLKGVALLVTDLVNMSGSCTHPPVKYLSGIKYIICPQYEVPQPHVSPLYPSQLHVLT